MGVLFSHLVAPLVQGTPHESKGVRSYGLTRGSKCQIIRHLGLGYNNYRAGFG